MMIELTDNIGVVMSEFNEFEPRLKSAKNRFQLSAGLNLETLNTILSETNHYLRGGLNLSRLSNYLNSASGYQSKQSQQNSLNTTFPIFILLFTYYLFTYYLFSL